MKKTFMIGGLVALALVLVGATTASAYSGKSNLDVKFSPERQAAHEEMVKAFENKDYNAWKTLTVQKIEDHRAKALEMVTEEHFNNMVQLHALKADGKYEEAKELWKEMGFEMHGNKGHRMKWGGH